VFHEQNHNVIFHTTQGETSHFQPAAVTAKPDYMDASETFRSNLLRLMAEKGFKAAELSKRAKLNARAVKDIEERRVASPKLSTVCALANALGADPAEMMGLGPRSRVAPALEAYLAQYDRSEQERILQALSALPIVRHD
jgi:transcriptional regulator with XRE-family HTH domain